MWTALSLMCSNKHRQEVISVSKGNRGNQKVIKFINTMPWRRDEVVIVSTNRTEDRGRGFESRHGVSFFSYLYNAVLLSKLYMHCHCVFKKL
jgi:hypothetical protein